MMSHMTYLIMEELNTAKYWYGHTREWDRVTHQKKARKMSSMGFEPIRPNILEYGKILVRSNTQGMTMCDPAENARKYLPWGSSL